jgi:rifampicin phosphotransferase
MTSSAQQAPVLIVTASDDASTERDVAGGKGASLATLVRDGFDVPPFFVVTLDAFAASPDGASDELVAAIRAAYDDLGGDGTAVAVRSSARSEDAEGASSAGLYDTFLGVDSAAGVVEAVERCWTSLQNEAAVRYRRDHHGEGDDGMAVVVQRLVIGEWSGVTFTANPVNLALSQFVVDAVPGMGEALVSGNVNPEQVVLSAADGAVLSRRSGNATGQVPDVVLRAVWDASVRVHGAAGFPQDIEWTYADGTLHLLQARPVPTVAAVFYNRRIEPWRDDAALADDPSVVWTRAYGDEVWTSPETPLNYSVRSPVGGSAGWFGAYLPMHGDTRPIPTVAAKYFRSAAYANVDVLKRVYEYHPRFARIAGVVNFFPPEMRDEIRTMRWNWRGRLRRHWQLERRDRSTTSLAHLHRRIDAVSAPMIAASDRWFDTDLDALDLDALRAHLVEEVGQQIAETGPAYAVSVLYHSFDLTSVLTGLLERWFGDGDARYGAVSSGLPGSADVAEAQAIWELARRARDGGDELRPRVRTMNWSQLCEAAADDAAVADFVGRFERFLRDHRHRGAAYKDIGFERWGDKPDRLLDLVKGSLDSTTASPASKNQAQGRERERVQQELLRRARWHPLRRLLLRRLFIYNEIYMGIRNDHRYYFDRLWYERRRVYLSMGRRLEAAGALGSADDVFFLGTNEIDDAFAGSLESDELGRRVEVRKAEWNATLLAQAPKFLRAYSPMPETPFAAGAGTLHGIAASPGVATGPARIVQRIEELVDVRDGDILVTRQTDPGWTPVFSRIAGLVLETGGVLAHGTSLCREYGLPCVTVVERATNRIAAGSTIELDGSSGVVRLLNAELATTQKETT